HAYAEHAEDVLMAGELTADHAGPLFFGADNFGGGGIIAAHALSLIGGGAVEGMLTMHVALLPGARALGGDDFVAGPPRQKDVEGVGIGKGVRLGGVAQEAGH